MNKNELKTVPKVEFIVFVLCVTFLSNEDPKVVLLSTVMIGTHISVDRIVHALGVPTVGKGVAYNK